jgi:probable phosphoglycerate mutase
LADGSLDRRSQVTPHAHDLLVVRHGESTWNVLHKFTGHADPPLSEEGRRQAADLARRCEQLAISTVVTSDLLRAYETGVTVADALGLRAPRRVPELRERWSETMTGMTRDEIESRFPGQLAAWREARPVMVPGNHEPFDAFAGRVTQGLVSAARHGGRGLVVAHAGVFVVLENIYGSRSASEVDNSEGRLVRIEAGRIVEIRPAPWDLGPAPSS